MSAELAGMDAFEMVLNKLCEAYTDCIKDRDARHEAEQRERSMMAERDTALRDLARASQESDRKLNDVAQLLDKLRQHVRDLGAWGKVDEVSRDKINEFIDSEIPF